MLTIPISFWIALDLPKLYNYELSKGGDLKIKFKLPKAKNCELHFTLYDKEFKLINNVNLNVANTNGKDGEVTLKDVNMNLHRLNYTVIVRVVKEGHKEKSDVFLKFTTPFPGI